DVVESFHQDVADRFADALSQGLQRLVEVRLAAVNSMSYSQFAFSRANPTCYVVLQAAPLPTSLALDVSPQLLFPVLDCLLGGGKRICQIPSRPPTELEQRLTRRVVKMLLDELHDAWEPMLAVELSVDHIENHAQRVRVVAPSESVVTLAFQVRVAEQCGEMTLCLPLRAIRKIVDKLLVAPRSNESANNVSSDGSDEADCDPRELVAYFEAEAISGVELSHLRPGDVLLSNCEVDGLMELSLGGEAQPQFQARVGAFQGRRAVVIVPRSA
ncbi:MAG: hypothetical protein KDA92_07655, partial [Planctomycetales bacterium]|nr:hypothetical protein [Planctomycetales bacterium]